MPTRVPRVRHATYSEPSPIVEGVPMRTKNHLPLLALPICMLALIVTSCTSAPQSGTEATPPPKTSTVGTTATAEKPHVALIMKSLANEFFQTMQKGAEAHQKAHSTDY